MIKILFVCHGNICRSTMAESYFTWLVGSRGLEDMFEIDSAGTSREETGNRPHYGTVSKLRSKGIPMVPHRARQMTAADARYYDLLIGMDSANIRNIRRLGGQAAEGKTYKLLEFKKDGTTGPARDVADPWYTDDFDSTYRDIEQGCAGLLAYTLSKMAPD